MSRWKRFIELFGSAREAAKSELGSSLADLARQAKTQREHEYVEPPPVQDFTSKRKDIPEQSIETLGRDASYDSELWQKVEQNSIVVESSNVYSYYFELETPNSGILYVTFLNWEPGMAPEDRQGPGATYAYFDFPYEKYLAFSNEAKESAGRAVWDFCRERGSVYGHQHPYRPVQVSGDYVPRKATEMGFADRTFVAPGIGPNDRRQIFRRAESRSNHPSRQFFKRSTLEATKFAGRIKRGSPFKPPNRGTPNRGEPDRGEPNRGKPNRGN